MGIQGISIEYTLPYRLYFVNSGIKLKFDIYWVRYRGEKALKVLNWENWYYGNIQMRIFIDF